jgi:2-methylcitrate dehydratase PrpD
MRTTHQITNSLSAFVSNTDPSSLPPSVVAASCRSITDSLAVTLAGVDEPSARIARGVLGIAGADAVATVVGRPERATPLDAAFANGTAAHALDFDDTHSNVRGHPSAPVLAAALAAAESVGASGRQLLSAQAIGVEIAGKLGQSLGVSHALQGFHSTSVLGTMGATAAVCHILGLDEERTAMAFGIAGSLAGGLRSNFGTMTKPLHVGNAARSGLLAALLAKEGLTSTPNMFDDPSSFSQVYSPGGDGDSTAITALGEPWEIVDPGLAVKQYPCCNRGSRVAEAIMRIVTEHHPEPEQVASVEVHLTENEVDEDGRIGPMIYPEPTTGLEGKFSMQYVVAAAVVDGALGIGTFADDQVARPQITSFLRKIRVVADPGRRLDDAASNYHKVVVRLLNGTEHSEIVFFARGDPLGEQQPSWDDLGTKFSDCAAEVLNPDEIVRLLEVLIHLDDLSDIGDLTRALIPEAGV